MFFGNVAQRDADAVMQMSDEEIRRALQALAAGTGMPERGATADDIRASQNLLIGEAIKRKILPAGNAVVGESKAPITDARAYGPVQTTPTAPKASASFNWMLVGGAALVALFLFRGRK